MIPRSYLYVPGDKPAMLAKAAGRGADALIVDLEDAVAPAAKASARAAVATWLWDEPQPVPVWVRVNAGPERIDDLEALAGIPALAGVVLAKTAGPDDLWAASAVLGATPLMPLLETAAGIFDAREIARQPNVAQLQIGEVDLAGELGLEPGPDEAELATARSMVVMASAAAGIDPPVGPVSRNFSDAAALAESTRRVRRLGFVGRACIHPAQIAVVHEVFTPTPAEVEAARAAVAALADGGVAVDADGRLIDPAVLPAAQRTLAFAERASRA
jgi:citrate lyase subunit beta/citryl-CoA lyase